MEDQQITSTSENLRRTFDVGILIHAFDNYTTVIMGTSDGCGDVQDLDAVVIVHTAAYNFEKRELFRRVYSDRNVTWPYKLKVVFLIGKVLDATLQINLEIENRQYGDTVQGNFLDSYQNLTLKAAMGYRWVSETCAPVYKVLLKMDDDVILDVHRFFGDYYLPMAMHRKKDRIFCQVWRNAIVMRTGKWKVEKSSYANEKYNFPYCSGFFVVIPPDIVKALYETAKSLDFFWIDDVFLYGMVSRTIKHVILTSIGTRQNGLGLLADNYKTYRKCLYAKGIKCKILATVTSQRKEFFEAYYNFPHQKRNFVSANQRHLITSYTTENRDKVESSSNTTEGTLTGMLDNNIHAKDNNTVHLGSSNEPLVTTRKEKGLQLQHDVKPSKSNIVHNKSPVIR